MYFELEIEYEKNIKGIYYKLTANKSYRATSVQELENAIKTAQALIIENHACITVNTVEDGTTDGKFYSRFYNFCGKYGEVFKMPDGTTRNTEDKTLSEIKKTIANNLKNVFEICLFNGQRNDKISYIILEAAFKDLDELDADIWKHDKGLIQADLRFIYNAYINYITYNETNTEELKHLNRLLCYDYNNSSVHANIIKKALQSLPEDLIA